MSWPIKPEDLARQIITGRTEDIDLMSIGEFIEGKITPGSLTGDEFDSYRDEVDQLVNDAAGDVIGLGIENHGGGGYSYDVELALMAYDGDRQDEALQAAGRGTKLEVATAEEDAAFIAHARQDVPALLAEVERLKKELAEAVKDHDKLIEDLTRLIPEEYDTDAAAEAIVVQWAEDQTEAWAKIREAHQPCPFGPGEGCEICEVLDGGEG